MFGNRWLPQTTGMSCARCSGDFLPPSPPAEKTTACQDQAGKASAPSLPGRLLFSALSRAAAIAPPSDEPSDHEHGPQESNDHAYADEHIG
jgi:hypothetical protein